MPGEMDVPAGQIWSARRDLVSGAVALVMLVGGFGGWATLATIGGAVIASGHIEVEQNRQVIQHPDGGIVDAILVQEGDHVVAGSVLLRLDAQMLQPEMDMVEGQLDALMVRRIRHEAERDAAAVLNFDTGQLLGSDADVAALMAGQRALHAARRLSEQQLKSQLGQRRDQIASQISGVEAQQSAIAIQRTLIATELESQQSLLQRGLTESVRVTALLREDASLAGRMGELVAAVATAGERMTELDIELLRIDSARREEALVALRDLHRETLALSERHHILRTQLDRLEIRAPMSGVVHDMQMHAPRAVLRAAEPVLYLVPQDRPLIISVQVEPTRIDMVFLGQEVMVRFPAFDQHRTPELFGRVVRISADAFEDSARARAYYRVMVALGESQIVRLPESLVLIPGMPVDAFIRTQDRSPMTYFVKPLTDYFVRAFREG